MKDNVFILKRKSCSIEKEVNILRFKFVLLFL